MHVFYGKSIKKNYLIKNVQLFTMKGRTTNFSQYRVNVCLCEWAANKMFYLCFTYKYPLTTLPYPPPSAPSHYTIQPNFTWICLHSVEINPLLFSRVWKSKLMDWRFAKIYINRYIVYLSIFPNSPKNNTNIT